MEVNKGRGREEWKEKNGKGRSGSMEGKGKGLERKEGQRGGVELKEE